jgi:hypothetical protein
MTDKIIKAILLVALIGLSIWGITECSAKKNLKELIVEINKENNRQIKYHNAKYDSCVRAKEKIDTIYDTITKYTGIKYISKDLTAQDSQKIFNYFAIHSQSGDTIDIYEVVYYDTLKTPDFELFWYVKVMGHLQEISFPEYTIYKEKIIKQWVINNPPPPVDPVIEYKYRKGWYLAGSVGNQLKSWTSWSKIRFGTGYMTRKGIAFGTSYEYFSYDTPEKVFNGNFINVDFTYFFGK